ncbi:hypothetical protein BT96DRAFT_913126 [Gymnopus androsaceus JB14]|uniref:Uncharacterized protein n=1 Tax=Gymnopus androsaceus JB14 TaxID=1447944 RepID=A0A6A4IHX8_9AGAR|nr:hypothetical protein BT96DRAFT_913126 [Gymnopus androsaceus JB14]
MHLAPSTVSLAILSLVSIVCAAPQPLQRDVRVRDELIYARETPTPSDDLPVVTIDAQEYITPSRGFLCFGKKKTGDYCYKAESAKYIEQAIMKAASNLGLPSGRKWRIEYSATSTVTLTDSTTKIYFTGPEICGGKCTAYNLGLRPTNLGLRPTIVDSKNVEIYPHLDPKLMAKAGGPTAPSHEVPVAPVERPAMKMKEPVQVKIDAYYNRLKPKGNIAKTEIYPKPQGATALEEMITEAAPTLGLPSDGSWKFKYSNNYNDLPAFANDRYVFKGVVPFTSPKGKYTADLAENTIKDAHGTVIFEAKRPNSSKSDVAAV